MIPIPPVTPLSRHRPQVYVQKRICLHPACENTVESRAIDLYICIHIHMNPGHEHHSFICVIIYPTWYINIYICIHIYIYMYTCVYVTYANTMCICIMYMYVCMYLCMYVCTYRSPRRQHMTYTINIYVYIPLYIYHIYFLNR